MIRRTVFSGDVFVFRMLRMTRDRASDERLPTGMLSLIDAPRDY
jgi:hypothetical protein